MTNFSWRNFNIFSWSGVLFSWLSSEGSFMYSSSFWELLILRGTGFWLKISWHMFFSETCIDSFYADMRQVLRAGCNHWYHLHHPVQTSCIWLVILVHFCLLIFSFPDWTKLTVILRFILHLRFNRIIHLYRFIYIWRCIYAKNTRKNQLLFKYTKFKTWIMKSLKL